MAMQKRFRVAHGEVFPAGAFLKGAVEPVADFNAGKREDGSRPQQVDRDTGLLLWQAVVLDADEEAGKKDTALTVKFAAKVQPVPPANPTSFPWTPVEFVWLDRAGVCGRFGEPAADRVVVPRGGHDRPRPEEHQQRHRQGRGQGRGGKLG